MSWAAYASQLAGRAKLASRQLAMATSDQKNDWLRRLAELLIERSTEVLSENTVDLNKAPEFGLNEAAVDRLRLTPSRLSKMAADLRDVTLLPDPVGEVIESSIRPNGLQIRRVRVPLGVVFFIFESRPNVTVDAASLCIKSGNAVILRGGKEALHSNLALHRVVRDSLIESGLPEHAAQLVESTERDIVGELLKLNGLIDVTIPRGGKSLIERVAREATMPVIKHFDGICHVYVDRSADPEMAVRILKNSKCQRPGVCNAAECVLIHEEIAAKFLPLMERMLVAERVELRGCDRTREFIPTAKVASELDYHTEYLDLILSSKVVESIDAAIDHIDRYGSHHTETIVTADDAAANRFTAEIDSAAVFVNASTRFNDGGELGLGAEIGISTDKFHARGPCGLRELTSYKWVALGSGQIRE
ncbi:MAG: glutamate-5-semialdehyde dehydrogenase [Planctomycetota bacterium]|nr:MAG: glutamate-5-semialdehyde dehydrogenase [Planctomycetota bacterium]